MEIPNETFVLDGITINDPHTVENLRLFILTGRENILGKPYKVLSEAMSQKQVDVKETGSVNQLTIDNNGDDHVFIHSGDILKGGKQDRTIAYDVIIPPRAQNIPLESFCVEQGRWEQRADEEVVAFSSNSKMLSSKDLKLAAKHDKNQGRVWSKVSEQKTHLNEKLSVKNGYAINVADEVSETSLQLALENEELSKAKEAYHDALKDLIDTPDALGYAYAINGEIHGVEIYNNTRLFKDLWDKILESVVVEAIGKEGEESSTPKTKKDVLDFMKAGKSNDKKTVKKLNRLTNFETLENKAGHLVFTTTDLEWKKWVHKSFMEVDTTTYDRKMGVDNMRFQNHE
ncbi:hypothetical protein K1F50_18605 [Muricauda oceani]|uniref:ARG and Rhodanese-Phosphatase-superfamily-associated domain-containing protein n=1 Tax=Flagellimonas oceani TaxID=2698672 RepID=A0A6G7IZ28_9FLAO|nr:DUF6569 family protein [Allomuricauda oceani]MBW8244826.1 hypothetical protein [Allomuricauda oceani]QII43863.1 hypothetical protein GVT53_03955 [Allomuricauda oceani]